MAPVRKPRIAHCVGFYFPDQVGGTEVYVQDLVPALARRSVDGYVIAATDKAEDVANVLETVVLKNA